VDSPVPHPMSIALILERTLVSSMPLEKKGVRISSKGRAIVDIVEDVKEEEEEEKGIATRCRDEIAIFSETGKKRRSDDEEEE